MLADDIEIRCRIYTIRWISLQAIFDTFRFSFEQRQEILQQEKRFQSSQASRIGWDRDIYMQDTRLRKSLCTLILEYSNSKCSDVRDKMFGYLALAKSCCQEEVRVNYKSAHEIGQMVVEHEIRHHSLQMFSVLQDKISAMEKHGLLQVSDMPCPEFSFQETKMSIIQISCRFVGEITKENTRIVRNVTNDIVSNCGEIISAEDKVGWLVANRHIVWTTGHIEVKDLVYQLGRKTLVIRRDGIDGLQVVGHAESHRLPFVPQSARDEVKLYLDFSAACYFLRIFRDSLSFYFMPVIAGGQGSLDER